MPKLDIEEIKKYSLKIFNNKAELLKYIEKTKVKDFEDYTLCICRAKNKNKWVVRWK